MKYLISLVVILGLFAHAEDVNIYGAAPGTPPVTFHPDSLWEQVNSCNLPGGTPHMGIFYDKGTLWHVVNTTSAPFTVYRVDTLGNTITQFNHTATAYGLGIARVGDSLFVGSFYPSPERVYVYDTTGQYARSFQLSNSGRCRGVDYDPNTGYFWIWGSPSTNTININICTRTGTVIKTINISGGYWTFGGCIDWKYYPNRAWYGDQQGNVHCYCQIDTSTGTGSILAQFPNPGSSYPEGTTYQAGAGPLGYVWVTSAYTATAWKMKVHDVSVGEEQNRNLKNEAFKISPNPSRGNVVTFSLAKNRPATINIYNSTGVKVATLTGKDRIVWKADLPAGVYFCEMDGATRNLVIVK